MPPLRHSTNVEPYDVRRSRVARWLCDQPEVMQWVFETAKNRGCIVFDQATGLWHGARYGD